MNRFHRLALATLATLALISTDAVAHPPTAARPAAPVRPVAAPAPAPRTYMVYYRLHPNDPWYSYGYTRDANDAYYYAWVLRFWGYDSYYR